MEGEEIQVGEGLQGKEFRVLWILPLFSLPKAFVFATKMPLRCTHVSPPPGPALLLSSLE